MTKILNVISSNLRLLFGPHHQYTRAANVNTAPFHQHGGGALEPITASPTPAPCV